MKPVTTEEVRRERADPVFTDGVSQQIDLALRGLCRTEHIAFAHQLTPLAVVRDDKPVARRLLFLADTLPV
jgi:hypothetical protein